MSPGYKYFLTATVEVLLCQFYVARVIRVTKLKRTRWAGNVVHMGMKRNAYTALVGIRERNRPPKEERIILK
jgi:hypothetical protein